MEIVEGCGRANLVPRRQRKQLVHCCGVPDNGGDIAELHPAVENVSDGVVNVSVGEHVSVGRASSHCASSEQLVDDVPVADIAGKVNKSCLVPRRQSKQLAHFCGVPDNGVLSSQGATVVEPPAVEQHVSVERARGISRSASCLTNASSCYESSEHLVDDALSDGMSPASSPVTTRLATFGRVASTSSVDNLNFRDGAIQFPLQRCNNKSLGSGTTAQAIQMHRSSTSGKIPLAVLLPLGEDDSAMRSQQALYAHLTKLQRHNRVARVWQCGESFVIEDDDTSAAASPPCCAGEGIFTIVMEMYGDTLQSVVDKLVTLNKLTEKHVAAVISSVVGREEHYEAVKSRSINLDKQKNASDIDQRTISETFLSIVAWDGLEALCYLHRNNVCHSDVRSLNFLVHRKHNCFLISDFSNSFIIEESYESRMSALKVDLSNFSEMLRRLAMPADEYILEEKLVTTFAKVDCKHRGLPPCCSQAFFDFMYMCAYPPTSKVAGVSAADAVSDVFDKLAQHEFVTRDNFTKQQRETIVEALINGSSIMSQASTGRGQHQMHVISQLLAPNVVSLSTPLSSSRSQFPQALGTPPLHAAPHHRHNNGSHGTKKKFRSGLGKHTAPRFNGCRNKFTIHGSSRERALSERK